MLLNQHLTHVGQPTKSLRLEDAVHRSSHQADRAPLSTFPCCESLCAQLIEQEHQKREVECHRNHTTREIPSLQVFKVNKNLTKNI